MAKAHEFQIKAESGHYFTCKIFENKEEMNAYYLQRCKDWGDSPEPLEFSAMVSPFERWAGEVLNSEIGEAIFYKGKLGSGLISHEMLHCALWHERLVEGNANATFGTDCGEVEERLCYTLTNFVSQFVENCYKLNLFE